MLRPRKAVLLAAGLGVRMRPLTDDIPKAMLSLWGRPIIDHVIDLVRSWGVREILVNAHHAPESLIRHFRDRQKDGMIINISFEPELLGTGGALKRAEWFPDGEPFWVINTDIAVDVSPRPFIDEFRKHSPVAALWLDPETGPRSVEMLGRRITNFRSSKQGSNGTYTFCGLQLVSPALLKYMPAGKSFSIVDIYERAMASGEAVNGVVVPQSYWSDLGTAERYRKAHGDILERHRTGSPGGCLLGDAQLNVTRSLRRHQVAVSGFAAVGRNAIVGCGTQIHDSVIWDGAVVAPNSLISNAIIAGGAEVSGCVEGVAIPCRQDSGQTDLVSKVLQSLGWKAGETTSILLGARGSDRSFTHLSQSARNAILIQYGIARPENARYATHARFLMSEGVPVPKIMAELPDQRATVMEYVGGLSLEALAGSLTATELEDKYRAVLDSLLILHSIPMKHIRAGRLTLEPAFSAGVYAWERELLAKHFLRGQCGLPEDTIHGVMHDLESVADLLAIEAPVLVHRDFQSSNILWRGKRPVFIDFQGMRIGPAAYDVASLLCDPYVMLPVNMQSRLLEYYVLRGGQPHVARLFWYAAVQRLAQALGAYGRLSAVPDMSGFARHIRPGLTMMSRALDHLAGLDRLRMLVSDLLPRCWTGR